MKLFTDVPLPTEPILTQDNVPGDWMVQSDWGKLLNEMDDTFTREQYVLLMSSMKMNLPIVLDWGRTKATVMVTEIHMYPASLPDMKASNRIRVHYWGFGHPLYFQEIISMDSPKAEHRPMKGHY